MRFQWAWQTVPLAKLSIHVSFLHTLLEAGPGKMPGQPACLNRGTDAVPLLLSHNIPLSRVLRMREYLSTACFHMRIY